MISQEFKSRVLKKLDRECIHGELLKRLFDRKPVKNEIVSLHRVEDELGFEGLIARLIYGNEYSERFGTGIPIAHKTNVAGKKVPAKRTKKSAATPG